MNRFALLPLVLALGACVGSATPPRNVDNACAIIEERPYYLSAMQATEANWGVPVAVQMATIYHESSFVSNARTPRRYALGVIPAGRQSSAFGYSQALDGTWDEYRDDTGRRFARRTDISDATDFMGWYMNRSRERNGIALTDARNQYLAYHEGRGGYKRKTYQSKPSLIKVARKVEQQAKDYGWQLKQCQKELESNRSWFF